MPHHDDAATGELRGEHHLTWMQAPGPPRRPSRAGPRRGAPTPSDGVVGRRAARWWAASASVARPSLTVLTLPDEGEGPGRSSVPTAVGAADKPTARPTPARTATRWLLRTMTRDFPDRCRALVKRRRLGTTRAPREGCDNRAVSSARPQRVSGSPLSAPRPACGRRTGSGSAQPPGRRGTRKPARRPRQPAPAGHGRTRARRPHRAAPHRRPRSTSPGAATPSTQLPATHRTAGRACLQR